MASDREVLSPDPFNRARDFFSLMAPWPETMSILKNALGDGSAKSEIKGSSFH